MRYSGDTRESDSAIEELLSSLVPSFDVDYQHLEPVLALHAVMTTVLLRKTLATFEENSNELSSLDVMVYRNQVLSLFKSVQQTLTQQIQLAIRAKRFEVCTCVEFIK